MTRFLAMVAVAATLALSACAGKGAGEGTYDKNAEWAASASFTDSCCCNPACPCLFGSKASQGHCDGLSLVELHRAHYKGVNLDGIKVVVAYRSKGKMSYYVTNKATKAQTEAAVKLIPTYIPFFAGKETAAVKNVAIRIERSSERIKVTVPDGTLEIAVMKGKGGMPIKLQNLPAEGFPGPAFLDHTQFKSVHLVHTGKGEEFDYEGTNGFTARVATVSSK